MKPLMWSKEATPRLLATKLQDARKYRAKFEPQWKENETTIFNSLGFLDDDNDSSTPDLSDLGKHLAYGDGNNVSVNYAFKHYRFIHAQMSANPPSVQSKPTTSDPGDRRRADAADKLCRHAIRGYKLQETVDLSNTKTLMYGTGWIKTEFDVNKGEITGYNEEDGCKMEGDVSIYSPSTWDVWVDPHARTIDDVRYIFERKWYSFEEAVSLWPHAQEALLGFMDILADNERPYADENRADLVEKMLPIFCYYEKGMPINGMAGRYVPFLEDGITLDEVRPSPFAFTPPPSDRDELSALIEAEDRGIDIDRGPERAQLPFHLLTDIDVADQVYGKSFVEYEVPIQDAINRLDSLEYDNIKTAGSVKMVLPEGCELAEGGMNTDSWEVMRTTGNQKPSWMAPPSAMPSIAALRDRLKAGGDDVAGVNDSMFGKQEREQSGFSMQYATNQGNMIRRRLFNKYVLFVESIYKAYLALIQKHWKMKRTIRVLGDEKAYESVDLRGADIMGGYDLVVEYGASLSLDPTSRREEIMALMPLFEKAGVDNKTMLSMLKLNELEGMFDMIELAKMRQQEIFDHIIDGDGMIYIAPEQMQDHDGMLEHCWHFVMTSAFRDLNVNTKAQITKHINEREDLKANGMKGGGAAANAGPQSPGPAGEAGQMPENGALGGPQMGGGAPMPAMPAVPAG